MKNSLNGCDNLSNKSKQTQRRSIFDVISEKLFSLLKNGMFGYFFTSYDVVNKRYKNAVKRKKKSHSGKFRKRASRLIEKSLFVNVVPKMMEVLLRLSLRDYGVMFFIMGAMTSVLYPLREKILFVTITFQMFVVGIAICLSAIPLLFSNKSLAYNAYTSKLSSSFLFDFMGVDREKMRQASEKNSISAPNITFFIGMFFGVLTYIISPLKALAIIGLSVLAYCVLRTPETGIICIILALPFLNTGALVISVLFVFLCFAFKCIIGKRTFKFEYFDLWVLIVFAFIFIRGFFAENIIDSAKTSLVYCCLMLSYFLVANLIRSKDWFRRSAISLNITGFIVSILAIGQMIIGRIGAKVPSVGILFSYGQSPFATFLNSDALAHFLVAVLPFSLINIISERKGNKKLIGFVICIFSVVAIGLSHSLSGLLGLLLAMLLLLIIFNRNFFYLAIIVGIMGPAFYFTLPKNALDKILSIKMLDGIELSSFFVKIREGFGVFMENPFGIGFGEKVWDGGLIINLLISCGIIGIVAFVAFSLIFARLTFSYCVKAKNKYRKINCCAGFCSVTGLLSAGIANFTWQDERLFVLLWLLIAFSFAYIRMEREEETPREATVSYVSATMDIDLVGDVNHDITPKRRYVRISKLMEVNEPHSEFKEYEETSDSLTTIRDFEEDTENEPKW